jgi:hypothetical protein
MSNDAGETSAADGTIGSGADELVTPGEHADSTE